MLGRMLAGVSAAVLLAAWITSAPPASNPDGGFHLVSIWCAAGTNDVDCIPHPTREQVVLVPREIEMSTCFAYDPLATGACAQQFYDSPIDLLGEAFEANLSGTRPQLYYRTMHLLKGGDVLAAITRMRAANALIALVMVAATSLLAGAVVRRALHAAWLGTSIPVGLWLLSTTNTGAWIIIGLGTAWANAMTATDPALRTWRRGVAGALALVGAVMALGARTEAVVPLAATALGVALLRGPSPLELSARLRSGRRLAVPLFATGAAVALVTALLPRTAQLNDPATMLAAGLETLRSRGAGDPVLHLLLTVPSLLAGGLGIGWGLGWIDTLVPVPVGVLTLSTWAVLLAAAIARPTRRGLITVAVLAIATFAFPLFTQAYYGLFVSEQFQPRHFLVMLYLLLGFAALQSCARSLLTRSQRHLVVAGITLAHAIMLHQQIRRYVSGLRSEIFWDLGRDAGWWWPGLAVGPTAVWIAGSVAFGVLAYAMSRALVRPVSPGPVGADAAVAPAGR